MRGNLLGLDCMGPGPGSTFSSTLAATRPLPIPRILPFFFRDLGAVHFHCNFEDIWAGLGEIKSLPDFRKVSNFSCSELTESAQWSERHSSS